MKNNSLFSIYNQRINYYDVATLYELADYRNNSLPAATSDSPVFSSNNKKIYYVNKGKVEDKELTVSNQTFKDYLKYLIPPIELKEIFLLHSLDLLDCYYVINL